MVNVECKGYKGELALICRDGSLDDGSTYAVTIDVNDEIRINISDCELKDIHFISK